MNLVRETFQDRPGSSKKGDFGKIAIIGGATEYPNTPAIVALGACRTGADLTVILAPERAAVSSTGFAPDLISRPLEGDRLGPDHVDRIVAAMDDFDAMVIGNGLDDTAETIGAVGRILETTRVPAVVDADALKADIRSIDRDGPMLLTPHRGEFEQLYEEPADVLGAQKEQVKKAARVYGTTILLKGPHDVVSDGDRVLASGTGNPYMARGGTGDILAGSSATLLAREDPLTAGYVAARITGAAGDIAAEEYQQSMMLEEVLDSFPAAIRKMRAEDR